jgi:hypothetical protein
VLPFAVRLRRPADVVVYVPVSVLGELCIVTAPLQPPPELTQCAVLPAGRPPWPLAKRALSWSQVTVTPPDMRHEAGNPTVTEPDSTKFSP